MFPNNSRLVFHFLGQRQAVSPTAGPIFSGGLAVATGGEAQEESQQQATEQFPV